MKNIYSDHGLSAEFIGFPNWNGIENSIAHQNFIMRPIVLKYLKCTKDLNFWHFVSLGPPGNLWRTPILKLCSNWLDYKVSYKSQRKKNNACLVMAIYTIKEKKKKQLPTTPMQCISLANQKVINLLPDCHIEVYECIVYWYSKYRSVLKSLPVNYWAQKALAPRS